MRDLAETLTSIALAVALIAITYSALASTLTNLVETAFSHLPH